MTNILYFIDIQLHYSALPKGSKGSNDCNAIAIVIKIIAMALQFLFKALQ